MNLTCSNLWVSKHLTTLRSVATVTLITACLVFLSSCQTNSAIQNVTLSYNAIKTVVVSNLPGGMRRESDNGRTLTSGFFDPATLKPEKAGLKIHGYVVVAILGSARPYNIDVHAFTEEKTKDGFEPLGENVDLSDRLAERLRSSLADRREDRNVIDDFRAF